MVSLVVASTPWVLSRLLGVVPCNRLLALFHLDFLCHLLLGVIAVIFGILFFFILALFWLITSLSYDMMKLAETF